MFTQVNVTCPQCGQSHCRESKWHSRQEKSNYPNSKPFRCPDCSHRFYERKTTHFNITIGLALAFGIAAVAILIVLAFGLPVMSAGETQEASLDQEDLKAAKQGNVEAQLKIGKSFLLEGLHTGKNSAEAVRWLQSAARSGNTEAMLELGKLYKTGVGALQNFELSANWIQQAAMQGSAEGMLELGRLYRDGVGFEKDVVRAYMWFNRSAAALDMNAVRERENIARTLTFEQLREAQSLSTTTDVPQHNNAGKFPPNTLSRSLDSKKDAPTD